MPELARILFQTKRKWIIIFPTFKDKIQVFWHYDIIYKFKCGGPSILTKLSAILKLECANTSEFLES